MFTETPDPAFVVDQATGREVPRSAVDPADIVAAAVPQPAGRTRASSAALARLDGVESYRAPRGMQLSSVSVDRGIDKGVAQSLMDENTTFTTKLTSGIRENAATKQAALIDINARETEMAAKRRDDAAAEMDNHAIEREAASRQELALRDQKDQSLDPNEFMRENGLAMVLLAAINGAFGAMRKDGGDGGKQFLGVVERRIDQNIAAQKTQIESGRLRRGNLIDFYVKQGLDAKEAEAAARGLYYAQAARFVDLEKERAGLGDVTANAEAVAGQLELQLKAANQNLTIASMDKVKQDYVAPKPKEGSGGMKAVKDALELDALLESRGYSKERRAAVLSAAGLSPPDGESKDEKAAKKPTEAQANRARALKVMDNLVIQLDELPEDTRTGAADDVLTRGTNAVKGWLRGEERSADFLTEEQKANRGTLEQAVNLYASQQSQATGQGALAGEEFDRAKEAAQSWDPRKLARAIRQARAALSDEPVGEPIQAEDR